MKDTLSNAICDKNTVIIIFIPIQGYENYLVGNNGQVVQTHFINNHCHKRRDTPLYLKTHLRSGYPSVGLFKNGKRVDRTVHSLVLEAFVGPRPPGLVAAHRNGIRADCRLGNLHWTTPRENYDDMERHGTRLRGERVHNSILKQHQVVEIFRRVNQGETRRKMAQEFRIDQTQIDRIMIGKTWKHITRPLLMAG